MKLIQILVAIATFATPAMSKDIVTCQRVIEGMGVPGAPVFDLTSTVSASEAGPKTTYLFSRRVANPNVPPQEYKVTSLLLSDETVIATADLGRGNYAHLFAAKRTDYEGTEKLNSLIDIVLKGEGQDRYGVATGQPWTDYTCTIVK